LILPYTITWRRWNINLSKEKSIGEINENQFTVIIPLRFVNSIFAPISALDNFSIASATGLNAAKR
jgi:hypothetical protein